jgi:hypothetical protein
VIRCRDDYKTTAIGSFRRSSEHNLNKGRAGRIFFSSSHLNRTFSERHREEKPEMPRYLSRRHERLMDESEQALWDAATARPGQKSRIAKHVLNDVKTHRLWEARHADLVRPVAEHKNRVPQVIALRQIEVRLCHKRALIDHIRSHQLRGTARDRMFKAFYGPKDVHNAMVLEHRQYMIAMSSYVSTNHLMDVMYDPHGKHLLRQYEEHYASYFDLYGQVVRSQEAAWADAARPLMVSTGEEIAKIRKRIHLERPDKNYADFDQLALLARSGRYPMTEYMVG